MISRLFISFGVVLMLLGALLALSNPPQQTTVSDQSPSAVVGYATALESQTPVRLVPLPSATPLPTYPPVNVLTVQTTNSVHVDDFSRRDMGWESSYSGSNGAWNGYIDTAYAFQLGNNIGDAGGRRLWDINMCCVLPQGYTLQFKAHSDSPQRGMVITDLQANVFDIENGSAVIVLFDVGYREVLRPRPLKVLQLLNGTVSELGCEAQQGLVISADMTVELTVSGQLVHAVLVNNATGREMAISCNRLDSAPSGRRQLGFGVVRSASTAGMQVAPLYYEYFEITEVTGVGSVPVISAAPKYPTVPCTGVSYGRLDAWIEAALLSGCNDD